MKKRFCSGKENFFKKCPFKNCEWQNQGNKNLTKDLTDICFQRCGEDNIFTGFTSPYVLKDSFHLQKYQ